MAARAIQSTVPSRRHAGVLRLFQEGLANSQGQPSTNGPCNGSPEIHNARIGHATERSLKVSSGSVNGARS